VIGVSPDSLDSHARFKAELNISFRLISDPDSEIASAYETHRRIGPKTRRVTYVIDSNGVIVDAFQHELRIRKNIARTLTALTAIASGGQ